MEAPHSGGGSAGVSPTNQPDKKLTTQIFIKYIFKYVINLKLGSSKIPHLPAGTPLAHIIIIYLSNGHVTREKKNTCLWNYAKGCSMCN